MNPDIIPNSKKMIKNIGFVEKKLSNPKPIKIPTTTGEIKSRLTFIPMPKPLIFFDLKFLLFSISFIFFSISFILFFTNLLLENQLFQGLRIQYQKYPFAPL